MFARHLMTKSMMISSMQTLYDNARYLFSALWSLWFNSSSVGLAAALKRQKMTHWCQLLLQRAILRIWES